ncbi:MAG: hypothetical protein F6J87_16240 [Spirulina sp. SIO3F2]|nr:hypothetical protein [Spirulina sp. SIO3F2]
MAGIETRPIHQLVFAVILVLSSLGLRSGVGRSHQHTEQPITLKPPENSPIAPPKSTRSRPTVVIDAIA